ncbi:MAG: rod shape-determining protein RodA [Chloroflexi bacterium]|nr:rod shape-determining protein RodA [Chloroflexota bacterium]
MQIRLWLHFDVLLFLVCLVLVGFGLLTIYSAAAPTASSEAQLLETPYVRQGVSAGIGLVLMLALAWMDYRFLGRISPFLYLVALGSLLLVLLMGSSTYGARRWINLGSFPVQPSEMAKLTMIIVLARLLADHQQRLKHPLIMLASLLALAVPAALVYLQPDLGTMIIFAAIWVAIAVMAGVRLIHLGSVGAVALLAVPFAYAFLLRGYMRERIATFFDPAADPLGAGYNMMQSAIGVGSGGMWGKGFMQGTQSQLHFLRIQKTDFIFSVFAEEWGFVGSVALFSLFVILLFRAVRVASVAPDVYGRLVAVGIVTMILFQVFINVGVNVRLLPVTGVPLPFISYGGNALITNMAAIGILQSINMRQKRKEPKKT